MQLCNIRYECENINLTPSWSWDWMHTAQALSYYIFRYIWALGDVLCTSDIVHLQVHNNTCMTVKAVSNHWQYWVHGYACMTTHIYETPMQALSPMPFPVSYLQPQRVCWCWQSWPLALLTVCPSISRSSHRVGASAMRNTIYSYSYPQCAKYMNSLLCSIEYYVQTLTSLWAAIKTTHTVQVFPCTCCVCMSM